MRDDIDIEDLKARLELRLGQLVDGRRPIPAVELDQSRVGRLSRMDAMQQQFMARAAARLTDAEAQRIRTALARMTSGEYGWCMRCDEEIAAARLAADPAVLLCITCARAGDRG